MFSFIGLPAFLAAFWKAGFLHLLPAGVLWGSWALPFGVILPIWYSHDHTDDMSAAWMVPIILIPLVGTAVAGVLHYKCRRSGGSDDANLDGTAFQNPVTITMGDDVKGPSVNMKYKGPSTPVHGTGAIDYSIDFGPSVDVKGPSVEVKVKGEVVGKAI